MIEKRYKWLSNLCLALSTLRSFNQLKTGLIGTICISLKKVNFEMLIRERNIEL